MIRLNKYIAECGICSRRKADILIESGKVLVNDIVIKDLGVKIDDTKDQVKVDGKIGYVRDDLMYWDCINTF